MKLKEINVIWFLCDEAFVVDVEEWLEKHSVLVYEVFSHVEAKRKAWQRRGTGVWPGFDCVIMVLVDDDKFRELDFEGLINGIKTRTPAQTDPIIVLYNKADVVGGL